MTTLDPVIITQGAELPIRQFVWEDDLGAPIDFVAEPHTFTVLAAAAWSTADVALDASVSADANGVVTITVAKDSTDTIEPGRYLAQVWARRDADDFDREPATFTILVKAAIVPAV